MGIKTVGVHAWADEHALHSRFMDENVRIGREGEAVSAYLDIEEMLRVAKERECDAIHPGYGFLSENAEFSRQCSEAGIIFIGPSADTLTLFGDKVQARATARSLYIPVVPGSDTNIRSVGEATATAARFGYPVMIKAAAGGGHVHTAWHLEKDHQQTPHRFASIDPNQMQSAKALFETVAYPPVRPYKNCSNPQIVPEV